MKNIYEWFRRQFTKINDKYWNVKMFVRNTWRFRKELVEFGAFDYSCNLRLFARSLEITADFLESDKAMTCSAPEHAEEIREFLDLLTHCQSPYDLAEARLGYRHKWELWLDQMDEARKDPEMRDGDFIRMPVLTKTDKDRRYYDECNRIEEEMWDEAWKQFSKQARGWWD